MCNPSLDLVSPITPYTIACEGPTLLSLTRRDRQVLRRLRPLHSAKTLVSHVEDSVDAFEERVSQDVKVLLAPALHAAINHTVPGIRKTEILLHQREQLPADVKLHDGKLVRGHAAREDVALLGGVVLAAGNGIVDGLADLVGDEGKSGAGVSNGGVGGLGDGSAVDGGLG